MEWVLLTVAVMLAFGLGAAGKGGGVLGLLLLIGYIVWAVAQFAHGTTPGKRVLGMYVVRENGRPVGFFGRKASFRMGVRFGPNVGLRTR
jgi:uncharacterized RDD family membrane protein YckC